MELAKATELIEAFQSVPRHGPLHPTFMELSGYPHYENVCSNILKFFLDPSSAHGLGSLCLDTLLELAEVAGTRGPLSNVEVEREKVTWRGNRLDLLISSDSHLVAIENKIFASPSNPFSDYADQLRETAEGRHVVKIVLALESLKFKPSHGFILISYARLIEALRSRLGHHMRQADPRYLIYFADFLNNIENLERGTEMDGTWLTFIRERNEDLEALMAQIKIFKDELRARVEQLDTIIDTKQRPNTTKGFYRESAYLRDFLYYDIKLAPDLPIAIDTIISPQGWEIQIFLRRGGNMEKLCELLRSLGIPFEKGERLIYPERFSYDEQIERLGSHLQAIVGKISSANPS